MPAAVDGTGRLRIHKHDTHLNGQPGMTLDRNSGATTAVSVEADRVSTRYAHLAVCLLVFFLGVVVRLHNLGLESIDLEEYACLSAIDAPDFHTFFEEQRDLYPYGAPLAPSLIYFWARVAGDSITRIRLLFALASILAMPVAYWLARLLFAPAQKAHRAGLAVLICVAFSPVHVFHAQEARMYAFVSLFTLLGMTAFLLGLRTNRRRWWWLHLAANAALVSSHYFAVFLFPVYGIFLLARARRLSRLVVWWGVGHGLLALLLVVWVSAIPTQAEELYSYYAAPTAYTVLVHFFAGDSTVLSATSFFPSDASWHFLPDAAGVWVRNAHILFDALLVFMTLAALAGGVFFLASSIRQTRREAALSWLLLLCWALLPVLLITALSFLWRPVYGSRYVMYSMFALYLLVGGVISHLPKKRLYAAALLVLALIYGYQLSIALPPQTRSAWRQSYAYVQDHSGEDALILLEDPFWLPVLGMNMPEEPHTPVVAAFRRDTLCDAATFLLDLRAAGIVSETLDVWVLLVTTTDFDESPFSDCLQAKQLGYQRRGYPGERPLALYHVVRTADSAAALPETFHAFMRAFRAVGEGAADFAEEDAIRTLEQDIRYLPDENGGFWLRFGAKMLDIGQCDFAAIAFYRAAQEHFTAAIRLAALAEQFDAVLDADLLARVALDGPADDGCARLAAFLQPACYVGNTAIIKALGDTALRLEPPCTYGYAYKGLAQHRYENHEQAALFFQRYYESEANAPPEIAEAYGISLSETGAYAAAVDVLESGIEAWPDYHWLRMRLGIALAALDRHEEAVAALRVSYQHAPENSYIVYLLMESLVALGRYEEAVALAEHPAIAAGMEPWVLLARWRAYTGAGMDVEGARLLARLAEQQAEAGVFYQHLYDAPEPVKARALFEALEEQGEAVYPEVYMLLERLEQSQ